MADGEEEGQIVPGNHVHGQGAGNKQMGNSSMRHYFENKKIVHTLLKLSSSPKKSSQLWYLVERQEDPSADEDDRHEGVKDAVGHKEGGHDCVVGSIDDLH